MDYEENKNERGIALITTLLLMVLGFTVVVTLIVMVTQGTQITGIEQRYTTALDASKGGADFIINMIRNDLTLPPVIANAAGPSGSACLRQKLTSTTSAANWSSCAANASTADPTDEPDITFILNNYLVSVKIIDTKESSTDYYYTIGIRSQVPNSTEHAEISILYRQEK
ncbi:MAG: hypothetical protein GX433_16040 [Deltaproteobacteria bacterium]|nr:hypothetical protein [Deltaproteobacteria bacterium]